MRAYVFVRYHSGDGAGHVGWGFELPDGRVCAGSVENHSGHLFTRAKDMGFWCHCTYGFADDMRKRLYDDVRYFDIAGGNYVDAYRVTKWIEESAYRAISRNCEDDVYDVLRIYGVEGLEAPFFNWFPRLWFSRLHGTKVALRDLPQAQHGQSVTDVAALERAAPLRPPWRKPWHGKFQLLNAAKILRFSV